MPTAAKTISTAYSDECSWSRSNQPWPAMIATAAAGNMIALLKLANKSPLTKPSNTGPACDGAPISAAVARSRSATESQLTTPEPRRPVNAATIIRMVPPIDSTSSGSKGAKRPISARVPYPCGLRPCRGSVWNPPRARQAPFERRSVRLVADGVLPANEGRGYVLRRIMRRAMRHAPLLGAKEPVMWRLVPELVAEMGALHPELVRA